MNKFTLKTYPGVKNAGFTLIELLVVVLIIGILASVAVPQYQKAVLKSRAAEMLLLARNVADAEQIYYLANGEYTLNLEDLDIEISPKTPLAVRVYAADGKNVSGWMVQVSANGFNITLQHYFSLPFDQCVAYKEEQDWLCKSLGGVYAASQESHRIYRINRQ